jgi:hypothetical protein
MEHDVCTFVSQGTPQPSTRNGRMDRFVCQRSRYLDAIPTVTQKVRTTQAIAGKVVCEVGIDAVTSHQNEVNVDSVTWLEERG